MSAFVVNQNHLRALITFAQVKRIVFYTHPDSEVEEFRVFYAYKDFDAIGQILHDVNVASVNYRYGDSVSPQAFKFHPYLELEDPIRILKACSCYDYQACEIPGYHRTEACEIIDAIRQEAIRALPGYDDAGWEIV